MRKQQAHTRPCTLNRVLEVRMILLMPFSTFVSNGQHFSVRHLCFTFISKKYSFIEWRILGGNTLLISLMTMTLISIKCYKALVSFFTLMPIDITLPKVVLSPSPPFPHSQNYLHLFVIYPSVLDYFFEKRLSVFLLRLSNFFV